MLLPEIRSIQPAPNKAVALTLWIRTGSKSRVSIVQPPTIFRPAGHHGEEVVESCPAFPAVLREGEAVEHSPHHLGSTRNRMNLEGRHVVLGVAAAANTPLEVAGHAGSFVEYRPQTIAAGQRIAGLPIMLEQGQTSLLDHRAGPRSAEDRNAWSQSPDHPRAQEHRETQDQPVDEFEPMSFRTW